MLKDGLSRQILPVACHSHGKQWDGHALHISGRAVIARRPIDAVDGVLVIAIIAGDSNCVSAEEVTDRGLERAPFELWSRGNQVFRYANPAPVLRI